jgi:phage-related protein
MSDAKRIWFISRSQKDLLALPREVQEELLAGFDAARLGGKIIGAKPLNIVPGGMEIVVDFNTDTYRGVYTTALRSGIYVLHCFKKKSKKGIKTPQNDLELIKSRFKLARVHHERFSNKTQ